jgi:4-amino-4-deoxy-L-arabinose transferase-like glycosyltransferase
LAATARRLAGNDTAWIAPVLAIGTLGFLTPLHDANPAIIGITGYALALLGLALWRDKPLHGGLLLGLGVGVGFLGTGIDTAIVALSVVPGVLLHPAWRVRGSLKAALLACLVALALALPWPWLLYRQSPALFSLWWSAEITSITPASHPVKAQIETLLWAAWPLLPLALWQLWLERRRLWQPQTWLPLWASSLSLGIFFLVSDARPEGLLLTLAPLSLLAASGSHRLRRGAANAFDWFGRMTFSLVIAIVWLGTYAMLTGAPERIAKNFFKATPGFVAQIPLSALALGGLLTVFWLALLFYMPRSLWRATLRWGVGLTTLWTLLALLWLPWIDYGKTYRGVSADFSRMLGNHPGCIVRQELGLAERAAFEYFSDIRTVGDDDTKTCRYLIQQTTQKAPKSLRGWRLLLETSRPGDKRESLRLYRRE